MKYKVTRKKGKIRNLYDSEIVMHLNDKAALGWDLVSHSVHWTNDRQEEIRFVWRLPDVPKAA